MKYKSVLILKSNKMDHGCENQEAWGNMSLSESKSAVYSLIVDYVFQEAYEEFRTVFTVDSDTEYRFMKGLSDKVNMLRISQECIGKLNLICFMDLLCAARTALHENGHDDVILEKAYHMLLTDNILNDRGTLADELKLQAVLSCCRRDEWDLANSVFERLWLSDDSGPNKELLQDILNDRTQEQIQVRNCPEYKTFLQTAIESLSESIRQFHVPYLHVMGVKMITFDAEYQNTDDDEEEYSTPLQLPHTLCDTNSQHEGNHDHHNTQSKEAVLNAVQLERRGTRGKQKLKEKDETSESINQNPVDKEEVIVEKIPRRELRSRIIPGYIKKQMVLTPHKNSGTSVAERAIDEENSLSEEFEEPQLEINEEEEIDKANVNEDETGDGSSYYLQENGQEDSVCSKEETGRICEDVLLGEPKELPITYNIIKSGFAQLGHGPQFWKTVENDESHLHNSLIRNMESSSDSEDETINEPSTSSAAAPSGGPSKIPLNFTKPLPVSSHVPAKKIQVVAKKSAHHKESVDYQSSQNRDEAGPSHLRNGHVHGSDSRKNKRKHKLRDIIKSDDEDGERVQWDSDDSDVSVDSIISKATLKSPKLRKSLELSSIKQRRPWSPGEVKLLIKGVKEYGTGNWAEILRHYDFARTNINLKDKWRFLVKRYSTTCASKMEKYQ